AQAAYLIEIDTDGLDDGVLTFNSHFGFGGDTSATSQSVTSTAFGMSGGDSVFGANGFALPDTFIYTYDPTVDADNLALSLGQSLGGGNFATGITGGGAGLYNIYA